MSTIHKDIVDFLSEVLVKNDFSTDAKITYEHAEDKTDWSSKNFGISVVDGEKTLDLLIKCLDESQSNEIYFYDVIYPAYQKFLKQNNVEDGLKNISKCYGILENKVIALENLKTAGFSFCGKMKLLDNDHIILALRSLAEIHAVSFAMKDHDREIFDQLLRPINTSQNELSDRTIGQIVRADIIEFLASLDPIEHARLLKHTQKLAGELVSSGEEFLYNSDTNEYDILIHGGDWCKNIMFLYEDSNKTNPKQVVLIDWQKTRAGIPVIDLSYFFYSIASKEALDNLEDYLRIYHGELSEHLRRLGSKPDIVYPFPVFKQQWKQHGRFGYYMAFLLTRNMVRGRDAENDVEKVDLENVKETTEIFRNMKKDDEYYKRLIILTEHMVGNEFI